MKYFIDTEFHEDGRTIDLISIGIVSEDGREYYAVNGECNFERIETDPNCGWLRENVMQWVDRSHTSSRERIKADVMDFIGDDKPEFWGYYADYDWVVFCQLFGRMIDLPKHFPMFCHDIKQFCNSRGNPKLPAQHDYEHHALADAKWNKLAHEYIETG